jgi:putative transposase
MYKFRAYPDATQLSKLEEWAHAQRALWNAANEQRLERCRRHGYDQNNGRRWLSNGDQSLELPECRANWPWLKSVPSSAQQHLLFDLHRAWDRFFRGKGGQPRFKRKSDASLHLRLAGTQVGRISRRTIKFPKLGLLRIVRHREIRGVVKSVAVTRDVDQYYLTIRCAIQDGGTERPPVRDTSSAIGLDMGVTNAVTDSLGKISRQPDHGHRTRVSRHYRAASRRRRATADTDSSTNYLKAIRKAALAHRKQRRQRADFLHNLSSHYAKSHGTVVIEDLKVNNMTRSGKGKRGLNREILNVGWHDLRRRLTYKCEWYGSKLIAVDPRYTSQACQQCGCIDRRSRATQMLFMCVECGFIDHADVNAAKNILDRGIGPAGATTVAACGGFDGSRPTKQEESA